MRTIPLLVALTGAALSQQTHVVNAAGGTPYQQIQAAVIAANPGDVIEILPGVYAPFVCDKALRIQGTTGVVVAETFTQVAIEVLQIPFGAACSISEIDLRSPTTPCICEPTILVGASTGAVVLDGIRAVPSSQSPRVWATDCNGLVIRDSRLGPLTCVRSGVHLDDVVVEPASTTSGALIDLYDAELDMTDGQLRVTYMGPASGIRLSDSRARLRVVDGLELYRSNLTPFDFQVDAASEVEYDPATTFTPLGVPTPWPFGSTGPMTAVDLAAVRVDTAAPGGTAAIAMRYATNPSFVCPLLALPGGPVAVPGIDGVLFVGSGAAAILGCYPTGAVMVTANLAVPNQPSLQGTVFVVQGLALAAGLAASNADVLRIQ
jgi:hypothetical protein